MSPLLFLASAAQIPPVNICTHFLAADRPIEKTLDGWADVSRDLPLPISPKASRLSRDLKRPGRLGWASEKGDGASNGLHMPPNSTTVERYSSTSVVATSSTGV